MSVERLVRDGPMQGRRIVSPPTAAHMAVKQVVVYHGGGQSSRVGPLLYRRALDTGEWVQREWTAPLRLAVPEEYEIHFFTGGRNVVVP